MSKVVSLSESIERFVPNGASVAMGMALESLIPFAAGHELIGAGCVRRVVAAWIGNVSAGLGHNYRRALEQGLPRRIEHEEHSNFSVGLGLLAAAMGLPYLPTRTLVGSDLARGNPRVTPDGDGLLRIAAIEPDVAILQVQRADAEGHAHCWGNLGLSKEAGLAARQVVLVAEEVVATEVVLSDPNRILLPPHRVAAVVAAPGGAHPSPVQGYYARDHAFYSDYHRATRDQAGFQQWLRQWVLDVPDPHAYLDRLGDRWPALRPSAPRLAAPVDYA